MTRGRSQHGGGRSTYNQHPSLGCCLSIGSTSHHAGRKGKFENLDAGGKTKDAGAAVVEWTLPSGDSKRPKTTLPKKSSSKVSEADLQAGASQESRSLDHRGAKRLAATEDSEDWKYLSAVNWREVSGEIRGAGSEEWGTALPLLACK